MATSEYPEHMGRKLAANFLTGMGYPITPRALELLGCKDKRGQGPPYTRFRWKNVIYAKKDLVDWAIKNSERAG